MMLYESDSGYKKINIWKDEMPAFCKKRKTICLNKKGNNNVCWHEGIICIEALLGPWHASNYAMVYMKYSSDVRKDVNIEINYGMENISFSSQVLPFNKKINVGLNVEFAEAIKEYFMFCSTKRLPVGTIEILGGGYDEVGSSNIAFKKVMDILLFIFENINHLDSLELRNYLFNNI